MPSPLPPTVAAIAANTPIGRERHHVAGDLEHRLRGALEHVDDRLALRPIAASAMPKKRGEDDDLQDVAAGHRVDDRGREQVQEDVPALLLVVRLAQPPPTRVRAERDGQTDARLERC